MLLGAKGDHFQYEEHQEGLDPDGEVRSPMDFGEFGDLAKYGCIMMDKVITKWVSVNYEPKFPFPCLVTRFNFLQFQLASSFFSCLGLHLHA